MINQPITDFSTLPPIMAVDFDGTLVVDKFPEIGKEREHLCNLVRELHSRGVKVILWTSRTGEHLENAVNWCKEHNIPLDAVNQNIPEVIKLTGYDTRKVFADVYVDDKSCPAKALELRQFSNQEESWLEKLV